MENDTNVYRDNIIEAINVLIKCDSMIFDGGLNILMDGELKEINKTFDIGDIYEFNINHFETSTDMNVLLIAKVLKNIRNTISSLQNLNAIEDEEIK